MTKLRSIYTTPLLLVLGIAAVFVVRTALAHSGDPPRLNDLFTVLTLAGSLAVLLRGYPGLRTLDWALGLGLGAVVALTILPATLFSPYPFFGVVTDNRGQALVRGGATALAALGGLVILRWGGPVDLSAARGAWRKVGRSVALGLVLGAPLALVNVLALRLTQSRDVTWQSPLAALLDALQPALVEEVVYRFALLGLLWLLLRRPLPRHAPWLAGLLALLIHTYIHFDDLFVQNPALALAMGAALGILWGLPLTLLALRRDLESAIAFHWVQDVARFVAGF